MGSDSLVYLSPTIRYASHQIYAEPMRFKDYFVQFVLQCRIKPNSPANTVYVKCSETVHGPASHFDRSVNRERLFDKEERYELFGRIGSARKSIDR